jgi:GDP-L-fucose synthase
MLEKNAKIFIAGHRGLVGSAIWNNLQQRGYTNLVGRSHKELDLLDGTAVKKFFDEERPEAVVLAVALWQTCNTGRTLSTRICKSSRT